MRPIIFSGTTEGRKLSEKLSASGISHIVCVATGYGELVMEPDRYAEIRQGRLTGLEMYDLIKEGSGPVFDATHPYAAEVSHNILTACRAAEREYVRILREQDLGSAADRADIREYPDAASCAEALKATEGNILLTTGSKEIAVYAADESVRSRLYARVLPSRESIRLCEDAGISGKHIIAMQGPFSMATDLALIDQFSIRTLVTKSSGSAGGAPDKIRAAAASGIPVYMIGRPARETGISVEEALNRYYGIRPGLIIDLIGTGPGRRSLMTAEARDTIRRADILFGAPRMVRGYESRNCMPYYRAEDIIPVLEETRPARAAVLFSGDTGFCSGAERLEPEIRKWAGKAGIECEINIHPGISSFAYLAARTGISYQDAQLVSIHGCSDQRSASSALLRAVRYNETTFVLLSGDRDVRLLGDIFLAGGLENVHIILGYQLSYPEERIGLIRASDLGLVDEPGLYTAIVINDDPVCRPVMPVISDDEMIRGRVPMTKESVRHLSVLRLDLKEGSVVYDIGSGTGSVACEIARLDPAGTVYAVEKKAEACGLIRQNAAKLGLSNIEIIEGEAPEALKGLPAPTHVFIGGSSGSLSQILGTLRSVTLRNDALLGKTDIHGVRVVINAVSIETISEIRSVLSEPYVRDVIIEQVSISRARELGSYHLMTAENPVFIASFTIGGVK